MLVSVINFSSLPKTDCIPLKMAEDGLTKTYDVVRKHIDRLCSRTECQPFLSMFDLRAFNSCVALERMKTTRYEIRQNEVLGSAKRSFHTLSLPENMLNFMKKLSLKTGKHPISLDTLSNLQTSLRFVCINRSYYGSTTSALYWSSFFFK